MSFYEGDPNAGGNLIGDAIVPVVPQSGSAMASVDWIGAGLG